MGDLSNDAKDEATNSALRDRTSKWVSGVSGGLVGAVGAIVFYVIPTVNTYLANSKEVSLAQIKNTAEQVAYITQRMVDSDKERDLYKNEMLICQKELRDIKNRK